MGWGGSIGDWEQPDPALALGHQAEMQPLRLLRPESEYTEESSSQERNSGITVACKELHPFLVNPRENVEVGNHDHCHGVY